MVMPCSSRKVFGSGVGVGVGSGVGSAVGSIVVSGTEDLCQEFLRQPVQDDRSQEAQILLEAELPVPFGQHEGKVFLADAVGPGLREAAGQEQKIADFEERRSRVTRKSAAETDVFEIMCFSCLETEIPQPGASVPAEIFIRFLSVQGEQVLIDIKEHRFLLPHCRNGSQ